MALNQNELFYGGNNNLWYAGYDQSWILGRSNPPPAAPKKEEKKEDESKKGVIELSMPLCCEGCVEKVNKKLKEMDGVASVQCDVEKEKVTVTGSANRDAVLKKAKKIISRSEFWKAPTKK